MADQTVVVTQQGYFGRLGKSFMGFVVGLILVVGSLILIWWNEGRAVQAERGLNEALGIVAQADAAGIDPALKGKLVHISGEAATDEAIRDSATGASFAPSLVVARTVEMYQWDESKETRTEEKVGGTQTTTTTYTYSKKWSESYRDSSEFQTREGHVNPPMPLQSQSFTPEQAKLGAWRLTRGQLLDLSDLRDVSLDEAPAGWRLEMGRLYKGKGSDGAPEVGDLRVSYARVASPTPVSIVGKQGDGVIAPYATSNGYEIELVANGTVDAATMIRDKQSDETILTWVLRAVGMVVLWIAFCMILGPLQAVANVVPFVASLIGGAVALVALALALPLGLFTMAAAWIFYRPFVAAALIVAGVGLAFVLFKMRARKAPPGLATASV